MKFETRRFVYAACLPAVFIVLLILIQVLDEFCGLDLYRYGNFPLDITRLYGIFSQPLFHSGFNHLGSNVISLFILMWFLFYFYGDIAFGAIAFIWGGSGVITWLIGRPSYHIGASGLIYGFLFFLFFSGVFRRIRELMALSVLLVFLYGSIIWGMLPIAEYIQPDASWEGHLSGAIAGFLVAIYYRNKPPQKPEVLESETDEEDDAGFSDEPEDISDNQIINR